MKTVLLFRHGKSDWDADYGSDHSRPLAKRGRKAARAMGQWLAQKGPLPDSIVSSTAKRAKQTLKRAQKAGAWNAPARFTRDLYDAYPSDLLAIMRREPDTTNVLMLIGHEPTWSETIEELSNEDVYHFPTAAMARIDLPIDSWREAAFGRGTLVWLQKPKTLVQWKLR